MSRWLAALERGCHVLVEKPIAEDEEDARRIGQLAEPKGLVASVNHSLLYDPQVKRALERCAPELGEVVGVDIFRSSEYPPYEGGPLPPTSATPATRGATSACTAST